MDAIDDFVWDESALPLINVLAEVAAENAARETEAAA